MKLDPSQPFEDRIAFLRKCNELYEHSGKSPISDPEYDKEYAALYAINPDHEFFTEVGGNTEHIYGTKVKHDIIMGSLSKSATIAELDAWLALAYPDDEELSFLCELKVDGLSLGCVYEDGKLVRVVTRGDGFEGVDVTKNAVHIDGVRQTIPCKELVEIRGEGFKDRDDFFKNWAGEYANPRNFASGSVNQKDPMETKKRGLKFIAYEVVRKEFEKESDKVPWLHKMGVPTFATNEIATITGPRAYIVEQVKKYMDGVVREKLPYDVDGVVLKLNDIKRAKKMGTTDEGKRPKANRAVKFPCEQKTTRLLDVEWDVGRTGLLAPVGILEPVKLAGTTVKRVSLHNPKFIREMGLTIGGELLLQKSGDIIPYVVRSVTEGTNRIRIPVQCPACGEPIDWVDAKEVNKVCNNDMCIAQLNARIEHWFKTLGVKGIGDGIIAKLTDLNDDAGRMKKPVVACLSDMYKLDQHQTFLELTFGTKAFANIQAAIHSVKTVDLALFIEALGIGKIGRMSKDIVAIAPTPKDIDRLHVEDITQIPGFADIKAKSFLNGWGALREEIDELLSECVSLEKKVLSSKKLEGKSFCFTGSYSNPTRGEMEKMVGDNGGRLSSVSKNLTALVWDEDTMKGKYEKATKMGIPIITQKDFLKLLEKE